jgi:nicotinamidase-related amidase
MTTLKNRPATALLVVDVQVGVVTGAPMRDSVVGNINSLVDKARRQGAPVIWVQHENEQLWPAATGGSSSPSSSPPPTSL